MRQKFMQFMQGRYGNDNLNNFLIYTALGIAVVNIIFKNLILNVLSYACWGFAIYRMLSRKIYKRNEENVQFLVKSKPIRNKVKCIIKGYQDKQHRYFTCPRCAQIVRVPKGRGKIEIKCPSCTTRFDKKS